MKKEDNNSNPIYESRPTSFKGSNISWVTGCITVSLGVLLAESAGSWDVTNHLLNKPETFFSPPHALLYCGVAMALIGSIIMFLSCWHSSQSTNYYIRKSNLSMKLVVVGVFMLISAGPFDFVWHSNFGLDGLLSPPHFTLTMGMVISSIGAMLGIIRVVFSSNRTRREYSNKTTLLLNDSTIETKRNGSYYYYYLSPLLIVIAILPLWLTLSGLIYMFSLPFSDTKYFHFNPDPYLAAILATLSLPFLLSFILYLSFELARKRFGIISITGLLFITIATITTIFTNEFLIPTIPFYLLNIIPIVVADLLLSSKIIPRWTKLTRYIAGAILGSSFFMLYYPLITHIFNEVFLNQPVWPSLTFPIYFEMVDHIYPLVVGPAMAAGTMGTIFGSLLISLLVRYRYHQMLENV